MSINEMHEGRPAGAGRARLALDGLREAALLAAGAVLLALSVDLFLVPADLAPVASRGWRSSCAG